MALPYDSTINIVLELWLLLRITVCTEDNSTVVRLGLIIIIIIINDSIYPAPAVCKASRTVNKVSGTYFWLF